MTLTVKDLTYRYAKTAAPVLQGISFTAESGDFLSVLGANGAGKSTLFRCLLGGLTDYTGAIELDGRDVRTLSRRETAEHIAYIPQIHRPTFGYSVLDTTLMGLTRQLSPFRSPTPEMEKQAMDALEQMGGWESLGNMETKDLPFREKDFIHWYSCADRSHIGADDVPWALMGRVERQNLHGGHELPPVISAETGEEIVRTGGAGKARALPENPTVQALTSNVLQAVTM